MKLLLSTATMQMHQQQAQQQNVTIDEIVQRETLISPDQTALEYKNEKIEGERATIEVKNSFGVWDTVPFVLEDGIWKIDKVGYADQMRQDIEQQNNQTIDDIINQQRVEPNDPPDTSTVPPATTVVPDSNPTTDLSPTPEMSPATNPTPETP